MNYELNEAKMYADITDGTAILINSETGIYYGLNPYGTNILENIMAGASTEDIVAAAAADGSYPADFGVDLEVFVNDLFTKEILVPAGPSSCEVKLDPDAAAADDYEMSCTEFGDAQELLLADPIHEVKEEEGWSPELTSLNEDKEDVARRESKMN